MIYVPTKGSGERHLYVATNARFSVTKTENANGVTASEGLTVAVGANDNQGNGAYVLNWDEESAGAQSITLPAVMRSEGMVEKNYGSIQ